MAMRMTIPTGGSQRVTIPIDILREKWGKTDDEISHEGFPLCFIQENDKVLIEPPERVVYSGIYPDELVNKVKDEWSKYQRRILAKRCNELYIDLAKGKITEWQLERRLNEFKEEFKKMIITYRRAFTERELHFIATGNLTQLIPMISIEDEQEKEENFLLLIEEVQRVKEEVTELKDILSRLEHSFNKGKISKRMYVMLKERFLGNLALVENRVNRLKDIVCRP